MGTQEIKARAISGFAGIGIVMLLVLAGLFSALSAGFVPGDMAKASCGVAAVLCGIAAMVLLRGLLTLQPNESVVLTFLGKYSGTLSQDGFWLVNPFAARKRLTRRLVTQEIGPLKVNDAAGNPVEIGMVLTWRVAEAARAVFDVENYQAYVTAQGETALRSLASRHPYDEEEYRQALATQQAGETIRQDGGVLSLRDGGDRLTATLAADLRERMELAGLVVKEARLSHLAYAPEIAATMLRKQAASAVIAARRTITSGAVSIVEQALNELEDRLGGVLDAERKAAMISNLLVVLVGDRDVTPVVNTGTLYS
ncbi:SPFH domain-containing protein [Gluconacetobacter tumulicola]|uniref:SPFH domain-containing protein n=1 Tax=Gluconacetobacter tumulicola TaxID=1017177 RepID=A0A7W4JB34_9PROT|nr:SPFH domain-containing protein [Gluconacetobacter tumulicola]MBB2177767.1 SPFH domain-containing protein [Gluconacetobacter tumulicola]